MIENKLEKVFALGLGTINTMLFYLLIPFSIILVSKIVTAPLITMLNTHLIIPIPVELTSSMFAGFILGILFIYKSVSNTKMNLMGSPNFIFSWKKFRIVFIYIPIIIGILANYFHINTAFSFENYKFLTEYLTIDILNSLPIVDNETKQLLTELLKVLPATLATVILIKAGISNIIFGLFELIVVLVKLSIGI